MPSDRTLKKILKNANEYEREYKWLEAGKSYESALHSNSFASFPIAETWQKIGFCYNRASRQTENLEEFKNLRAMAVNAYKNAASFFKNENSRKNGNRAQCSALAEFARSWVTSNLLEKKKTLNDCRVFGIKALKEFKKNGDEINYVKVCNNLLLCLFEHISIASTQDEKQTLAQEGIRRGNEAISILSNMSVSNENKIELLLANSLVSLHSWYSANINDKEENRKKLANMSLIHSDKAIELSDEIDNPYYIAMSRWAAALSRLYFTEKIESSLKCAKEMLQQGVTVNDNYIKGIACYILTHIIDWIAAKESNPDKKREYYTEIIKYSQDASASLQLVSQDYYIAETYLFYTESYTHLGREVEIEIEGKRALLRKAVEIGHKGLEHATKSGYPDAFAPTLHSLSKALHYYSILVERKGERICLLKEALRHRKEFIKIVESAFPSYTWSVGVGKNYAGLIEAELARLETDNEKKISLLAEAISDMKDAISYCTTWVCSRPQQFGGSTTAVIAEFESTFGGILCEQYQLTKEKSILINAIEVNKNAAKRFKEINLPSRAAESYWKIARIQDRMSENQKASSNFKNASIEYKTASRRLPQFVDYYTDHSIYMKAWSEIETAKSAHKERRYNVAMKKYQKIAALLKQTKLWNYLSSNFLAWSLLDRAENFSRKEQQTESIQSFQFAMEHFEKAEESIDNKIKTLVSEEEKEQATRLLKASFLRRRYCQARISLEKAKIFSRKGAYNQSSESYADAREVMGMIVNELESEEEKRELRLIINLTQAWEKMALAEEQASAEIYLEASRLFERAKTHSPGMKTTQLILGNSSFCKGLAAGVKYQTTLDPTEHAKAKGYIKNAATKYLQAGFKSASEYAKGTQRLFDAYAFMNKAESEVDQQQRAKQYQMAEKMLQISVNSFIEAKQPEKTAQIKMILENVREERNVAVSLNEVLDATAIASTTLSFSTPTPTGEVSVGLERFEHANVQANLIAGLREVKVGESFCLTVEFVNVGKESALLTKIEDLVPSGFAVVKKPEIYRLEDTCLNMKGKQIAPLKFVETKLVLQPSKKGIFQLKPTVHYLDELGQNKSLKLKSVEITVEEVILADRVSTGTRELDSLLLGGIPKDYAIVLTGSPSDERELIIRNFLEAATKEDQTSFYVTTEVIDVKNLIEKPSFYLFLCNPKPKVKVPDLPNVTRLRSKTDLTNLNIALLKAYRNIEPSSKKRVCIGIVSDVLADIGLKVTRRWISELITDMVSKGFTILAVMNPGMHPSDQAMAVVDLFDGEISICQTDDPLERRKSLRIKKLRDKDYIKNPIYLTES